jgi:hypothetical protein
MPAVEPLPFTFAKNAACAVYGSMRLVDTRTVLGHERMNAKTSAHIHSPAK